MEAQQQALSAQLQAMTSDIKPAKKPRAVAFQEKVDGAIASLSDTVDRLEQIVGHTPRRRKYQIRKDQWHWPICWKNTRIVWRTL
jgi:hypothetical protein